MTGTKPCGVKVAGEAEWSEALHYGLAAKTCHSLQGWWTTSGGAWNFELQVGSKFNFMFLWDCGPPLTHCSLVNAILDSLRAAGKMIHRFMGTFALEAMALNYIASGCKTVKYI